MLVVACLTQIIVPLVRISSSYRATELGLSPGQILLIASTFSLLPAFLAVAIGRYNDRHGHGTSAIAGAFCLLASCLLLLVFSGGLIQLILISTLLGLGLTLQLTSMQGEIGMMRLSRHRVGIVGTMMLSQAIGQLAAPLILSLVALAGGPLSIGLALAAGGLALISGVFTLFLWRNAALPIPTGAPPLSLRKIVGVPGLFWVLLSSSLCVAVHDLTLVLMPVVGEARAIPPAQVGVLLAFFAGGQMLARAGYPKTAARFGPRNVMLWAIPLMALFTALVALPLGVFALGTTLLLMGLAMGFAIVSSVTLTMDLAPPGARGASLGLRLAMNRVGQFLIPLTAAGLTGILGAGGAFFLLAAGLGGTGLMGPKAMLRSRK